MSVDDYMHGLHGWLYAWFEPPTFSLVSQPLPCITSWGFVTERNFWHWWSERVVRNFIVILKGTCVCVLMIGIANIDQPLPLQYQTCACSCSPCTCCALKWAVFHVLAMWYWLFLVLIHALGTSFVSWCMHACMNW